MYSSVGEEIDHRYCSCKSCVVCLQSVLILFLKFDKSRGDILHCLCATVNELYFVILKI